MESKILIGLVITYYKGTRQLLVIKRKYFGQKPRAQTEPHLAIASPKFAIVSPTRRGARYSELHPRYSEGHIILFRILCPLFSFLYLSKTPPANIKFSIHSFTNHSIQAHIYLSQSRLQALKINPIPYSFSNYNKEPNQCKKENKIELENPIKELNNVYS